MAHLYTRVYRHTVVVLNVNWDRLIKLLLFLLLLWCMA